MYYIHYNPNPTGRYVGDCSIRAIAKALNIEWDKAYKIVNDKGFEMGDMPSSDSVWGSVLKQHGFSKSIIPNLCPNCYTAGMFCRDHPDGIYVLGFGNHVATVVNGLLYDSWNSENQIPVYYWYKRR